jgi:hypothetical protein
MSKNRVIRIGSRRPKMDASVPAPAREPTPPAQQALLLLPPPAAPSPAPAPPAAPPEYVVTPFGCGQLVAVREGVAQVRCVLASLPRFWRRRAVALCHVVHSDSLSCQRAFRSLQFGLLFCPEGALSRELSLHVRGFFRGGFQAQFPVSVASPLRNLVGRLALQCGVKEEDVRLVYKGRELTPASNKTMVDCNLPSPCDLLMILDESERLALRCEHRARALCLRAPCPFPSTVPAAFRRSLNPPRRVRLCARPCRGQVCVG